MKLRLQIGWMLLGLCLFAYSQNVSQNIPAGITAKKRQQLEGLIKQLGQWPLAKGKKAARLLIGQGKISVPFLRLALKEGNPRLMAGAAYCLGNLKVVAAFPDLVALARNRKMLSRLKDLFAAMAKIDRDRAYPILLEFLQSRIQTGRYPAYRQLSKITADNHWPLLLEALKAKYAGSRKYVVQLIALTSKRNKIDVLLDCMKDPAPQVAKQACEILGYMKSNIVRDKLLAMSTVTNYRWCGYAILALVIQEDRLQRRLFDQSWIPVLLARLQNIDYFIRGTAAVALVNVGFATDNPQIIQLMDKKLVPILLETIAGKVYFKDYVSLRPLAYKKLQQLTGKNLGQRMNHWWAWWHTHKGRFRAIRLLRGISLAKARSMRLEYISQGSLDNHHFLFLASPDQREVAKRTIERRVIILEWEQTVNLLNLLQEIDFFSLAVKYGHEYSDTVQHSLQLTLHNHVKKVDIYQPGDTQLTPLIHTIMELASQNSWQLYWDNYNYPDWNKWYANHEKWFAGVYDRRLRNRRTKRLLLESYSWLTIPQRNAAAQHLVQLMEDDPWLSKGSIEAAIVNIQADPALNRRTRFLIQAVAMTKDPLAINPVIRFLLKRYSLKTRKLLVVLLKNAQRKLLLQYLRHPNPHMRSIAAEIFAERDAEEVIILYLIAMLKDKSNEVRQSTITALGKLRAKLAWEKIRVIAQNRDEQTSVRQSAILALAKIAKDRAAPVVLKMLSENNSDIRIAVLQALGEIGDRTAVQTLVALLSGGSGPQSRQVAANSLLRIGGPKIQNALLYIALKGTDTRGRTVALRTLSQLGMPQVPTKLAKLRKDSNVEIRIHAALALAEFYDRRAIPVLIAELENRRYSATLRRQLEKLTLIAFPQLDAPAAKIRYRDWWRTYKSLSAKQWLFEALQIRGYNVSKLLDYLLGASGDKAISLLVKALADRSWFIRVAACRHLQKISGQAFGVINEYTGVQRTRKISRAWRKWYREKKSSH